MNNAEFYEWVTELRHQLISVQVEYDTNHKGWLVTTQRKATGYRTYLPTPASLKRVFLALAERVNP